MNGYQDVTTAQEFLIEEAIERLNSVYLPYFSFDKVDKTQRVAAPDLFDRQPNMLKAEEHQAMPKELYKFTGKYHRGDYASLNIYLLYRFDDYYDVPDGTGRFQFGGRAGRSSLPKEQGGGLDSHSGVIASSASIWPTEMGVNRRGLLASTYELIPHEIGHWLGVGHTDGKVNSCADNDGIADTPPHFLSPDARFGRDGCPLGQHSTCARGRPEPLDNIMFSVISYV